MRRHLPLPVLLAVAICGARGEPFDPRARPLSAERPDITDSTSTVGRGVFQLESGVTLARSGDMQHRSLPDAFLRFGTAINCEVRVALPTMTFDRDSTGKLTGGSDMQISFKTRVTKPGVGRGLFHPKIALTAQTTVPTGAAGIGETVWQPGIKLGIGYILGERLGVTSNLVYDRASDGGERFDRVTASASFEYKLRRDLHPILEYLRVMPSSPGAIDNEFVDIGAAYWVNKDLALDMLFGIEVDGTTPGHFLTTGFSKRW